ncbi:MAG: flagellar export protein FliJ [Zoogloea sp.]|nr:flagellar export protein FliJ [Zoogloea sp.]
MSTTFPLQTLLDLANDRMDEAARHLGELIASEQAGEKKLALLQQYRDEYRNRFLETVRSGVGPEVMRNFSAFIGRLDEAIAIQKAQLDRSKQQTAQGQQHWLSERNRVKAFDTLSERHQQVQAKREAKQEQRFSDEHAAKQFRQRQEDESQ